MTTRHFVQAVVGGIAGGNVPNFTLFRNFVTLPLSTVNFDTAGRFNTGSYIYTVPLSGYYNVQGALRLPDGAAAGLDVGIGVDTSNADSPTFQWDQPGSGTTRKTFLYTVTKYFKAGDPVRMFAYADSATSQPILSAALTLSQIA